MLAAALHAHRGIVQMALLAIDLGPARADHLARPGGGEDDELERQGGDGLPFAEPLHEGRNVAVGHGGVVATVAPLALRQEVFEVTAPAGGIGQILGAQLIRLGVVEDPFDRERRREAVSGFCASVS